MKPPSEMPPTRRSRHGLNALKARVKVRGLHAIDKRTAAARAVIQWKKEVIQDLGGEAVVSVQQRELVDLAARTKLYLDSVDAWLMEQRSLVNARRRAVLPIVLQRQQLADALARYLGQLGTIRRPAAVATTAVDTGPADPDFPFMTPDEARRLKELKAQVDAGEVKLVDFYRAVGPIFKAEQEARSRRNGFVDHERR